MGTLVGKVVDERGNRIAAARVRLGQTTTDAVTDTAGTFRFPHVPAGSYQVEVTATTLTRFREGIRIRAGRVTEVELTVTDPSKEPEFFGTPADRLTGRFRRFAFLPTSDWYTANSRWDSVRTAVEPLLVDELRTTGFEVVDRDKGVAICKRLADSLGGNFDRKKGRVDPEREAILRIQTLLTLLNEYEPDGFILWGVGGSRVSVYIEDSGGHGVYRHEVDSGVEGSHEEKDRSQDDYAAMFHEMLEPFYEAVGR